MASKNVATALAMYDAFNARDYDKMVSAAIDNVPWEDHGRGSTTKTRAELKDSLAEWVTGFSDGKITDVKAIDAGDTVIVQYTGRGTNDGAMGPAPATGKRASLDCVDIVHFDKAGKINRGETYFDMFGLLVQLGLAEMPVKA